MKKKKKKGAWEKEDRWRERKERSCHNTGKEREGTENNDPFFSRISRESDVVDSIAAAYDDFNGVFTQALPW